MSDSPTPPERIPNPALLNYRLSRVEMLCDALHRRLGRVERHLGLQLPIERESTEQ